MKKSFITTSIAAGLMVATALTAMPTFVGAQAMYYSGYNARPYWNKVPNASVVQGQTLSLTLTAVDENGDSLSYSVIQAPTGASYNQATRIFSFTPTYNQLGSFPVTISATDGKSAPTLVTFYVNVTTDYGHYVYGGGDAYGYYNQAPYFSSTNSYYIASSGSNLSFTVTAIDPEGQTVTYAVDGLPSGASFDAAARRFSWTPLGSQRGTYSLSFRASDGYVTSIPFNVSIVVDGGVNSIGPITNPVYGYNDYAYGYSMGGRMYFATSPSTVATAGTMYTYDASAISPSGSSVVYQMPTAPDGAYINASTGLVAWSVPSNATNGQVMRFTITATDGRSAAATQDFNVAITGGTPSVTTVVAKPQTVVRYDTGVSQPVANVSAGGVSTIVSYYPSTGYYQGGQVSINAGRVVPPQNYQYSADGYYAANAYGALLPAANVGINAFNISVRVNAKKEMVVSWDTNKPTTGEVVFGYASQSRGNDLNRTILNYDFTSGQAGELSTRHEASLGALDLNRTYYLRVISRADNQTDISREIVFIPMPTEEGKIIINQSAGAASAAGALGAFLTSGGFLFFLLLIVIGLIAYLIIISRRPLSVEGSNDEIQLAINHAHDNGHGEAPHH